MLLKYGKIFILHTQTLLFLKFIYKYINFPSISMKNAHFLPLININILKALTPHSCFFVVDVIAIVSIFKSLYQSTACMKNIHVFQLEK